MLFLLHDWQMFMFYKKACFHNSTTNKVNLHKIIRILRDINLQFPVFGYWGDLTIMSLYQNSEGKFIIFSENTSSFMSLLQ